LYIWAAQLQSVYTMGVEFGGYGVYIERRLGCFSKGELAPPPNDVNLKAYVNRCEDGIATHINKTIIFKTFEPRSGLPKQYRNIHTACGERE